MGSMIGWGLALLLWSPAHAEPIASMKAWLPQVDHAKQAAVSRYALVRDADPTDPLPVARDQACVWLLGGATDAGLAEQLREADRLAYLVMAVDEGGPRFVDPLLPFVADGVERNGSWRWGVLQDAFEADRAVRQRCGADVRPPAALWVVDVRADPRSLRLGLVSHAPVVREIHLAVAGRSEGRLERMSSMGVAPYVEVRNLAESGHVITTDGTTARPPETVAAAVARISGQNGDEAVCTGVTLDSAAWSDVVALVDQLAGAGIEPVGALDPSRPVPAERTWDPPEELDLVELDIGGYVSVLRIEAEVAHDPSVLPVCAYDEAGVRIEAWPAWAAPDDRGLVELACQAEGGSWCTEDVALLARIYAHRQELGQCYESGLAEVPLLRGFARLEVTVAAEQVTGVTVRPGLAVLPEVAACWAWVAKGWRVPLAHPGTHMIGLEVGKVADGPKDRRARDPDMAFGAGPSLRSRTDRGSAAGSVWLVGNRSDATRWWVNVIVPCLQAHPPAERMSWSSVVTRRVSSPVATVDYEGDPLSADLRSCLDTAGEKAGPELRPTRLRVKASWEPVDLDVQR